MKSNSKAKIADFSVSNSIYSYFKFFQQAAGVKLYIFLFLSIGASFLDGLGITALIPMISLDFSGEANQDIVSRFIYSTFSFLEITPSIRTLLAFVVLIFSVKLVFSFSQYVVRYYITTWLAEQLKRSLVKSMSNMTYRYYTTTKIGYLNNLITTEVAGVVACFKKLAQAIVYLSNFIAYLSFSFVLNWFLSSLVIITGLIFNILYKKIRISVARRSYHISKVNAKAQNVILQFISNFKYLKATANNTKYIKHIFPVLYKIRMLNFKNQIFDGFTITTYDFFRVLILVFAVFYMVEIKGQKVTDIIIPLALIARSFGMVLNIQSTWQQFMSKTGSIEILMEANENINNNLENPEDTGIKRFQRIISLENVCYAYGVNQVLHNIQLNIKKGRCVGFAGPSGSGKTTLIDIIVGLLDPSQGSISIDNRDYSKLNKDSLRSQFGYIAQDPILFNDSVKNNISFWEEDLSSESKIEDAINFAGCSEFISNFPEGVEAIVGDKGVKLSGGQRQRISIAREIYQNSDIMVFDEATASLDSESERIIQDSIEKLRGMKTVLIIAHRLSTLKICDEIYILDKGKIVEQGRWDDLVQSGGFFEKMCKMQGISSV